MTVELSATPSGATHRATHTVSQVATGRVVAPLADLCYQRPPVLVERLLEPPLRTPHHTDKPCGRTSLCSNEEVVAMGLAWGMWSGSDALLAASSSGTNPLDSVVSYLRSAAAAVGGWLGRTAPEAHLLGTGHAVAAMVAITGVVMGAAVVRCTATRRALRHRVSYAVLPTDTFDPTPEEIIRVASHLSRTRRAVFGSFVRRATALRVRLDQTADGRMLYSVEGPARASSLLRSLGYDEVEIRQVERPEDLPAPAPVDDSRSAPSSPQEKPNHDDVDRDVDSVDRPDRLGEALKALGVEA